MKIIDILNAGKYTLSFEVFPPKIWDNFESVKLATEKIARLKPDFMSVTCGAGGSTDNNTTLIASGILHGFGVSPIAHMTCVSATREKVRKTLEEFKKEGIENILALRGDIPKDMTADSISSDYLHANELVQDIKGSGDFCVGCACYPEGHPESENLTKDIIYLKKKVEAGCDFMTTQMFFDNNILYNFLYRIREAGITVPVVAGIMPVTNGKQTKRICSLSGTALPPRFAHIVDKFGSSPSAMTQAGIAYATEQIIDLYANGIKAVHVYSMNKPEVAAKIQENISDILGKDAIDILL